MKTLPPELQTGGEIILLKWRFPHPPTSVTHPPMLVGANLNESSSVGKTQSSGNLIDDNTVRYQLPPTDRKGSLHCGRTDIRYISTHKYRHTLLLPSFIGNLKGCLWYSAVSFQSICCRSREPIIFSSFVHVPCRTRVEWI